VFGEPPPPPVSTSTTPTTMPTTMPTMVRQISAVVQLRMMMSGGGDDDDDDENMDHHHDGTSMMMAGGGKIRNKCRTLVASDQSTGGWIWQTIRRNDHHWLLVRCYYYFVLPCFWLFVFCGSRRSCCCSLRDASRSLSLLSTIRQSWWWSCLDTHAIHQSIMLVAYK
jgi:hypothetical protein